MYHQSLRSLASNTSWRDRYDAAGIVAVHRALSSASAVAGIEYVRVRYEDLVANPDGLQGDLSDRFGLSFNGRFSEFHQGGKRHAYRYDDRRATLDTRLVFEDQPANASRQGKWRAPEHRERIMSEFTACEALFDILIESGYEKDRKWFDLWLAEGEDP